jgi:hypothetical protein
MAFSFERFLLPVALVANSCIGEIGGTASPEETTIEVDPESGPIELRMLTQEEYLASIRVLLGVTLAEISGIDPDNRTERFATIGGATASPSSTSVSAYERMASLAVKEALSRPELRARLIGCSEPIDSQCIQDTIASFGRLAFRRPLAFDELQRWSRVATELTDELGSGEAGLGAAFSGMLQSPRFLYRVELGEQRDALGPHFNEYETASRLSFLLFGEPPDDALLDAARSGALDTTIGILAQVDRMLTDPRAEAGARVFFADLLELWRLASISKDDALMTSLPPNVFGLMREQVLRFGVEHLIARGDPMESLLTSNESFIHPGLSGIYGSHTETSDWTSYALDSQRPGLLGHASFLTVMAGPGRPSPVLRGRFILEALLCDTIPPPPADVDTSLPTPDPNRPPQTRRQELEEHLNSDSCVGCHGRMDPVGFAFEAFDAVGRVRDTDNGLPVDTSGSLNDVFVSGGAELSSVIARSEALIPCFSERVVSHALGRSLDDRDREALDALTSSGIDDYRQLIRAFVQSDLFLRPRKSRGDLAQSLAAPEGEE